MARSFYTLEEVRMISGRWRDHYDNIRPHSSQAAQGDFGCTSPQEASQLADR
jgi:hypothetical protein